jgi:cell division protein FtsQ
MWDNAALLRSIANALFVFSVLAALYGAAYYAAHLPGFFPLRSVRLNAAPQRVDGAGVLQAVRNEVRGNFFTVDIERLRQSLEKLPWVRGVSIRREFPYRLAVQLEEHQALARWNNAALVNQQGEVFVAESKRVMPQAAPRPDQVRVSDETTSQSTRLTYNANQVAGYGGVPLADASGTSRPPLDGGSEQVLPSFIGPDGAAAEVTQHYAEFSRQLAALDLQVTQLALSPRHAWQLRLSNGTVLELGREDMQQRLARFVEVYPYSLAAIQGKVKYVDLRYRNGFAVSGLTKQS